MATRWQMCFACGKKCRATLNMCPTCYPTEKTPNLTERVERIIRAWPQWSRAERRGMDDLIAEIMDHVRNGTGNAFVRSWCERVLTPALRRDQ